MIPALQAEEVRFTASAPSQVAMGERFRVVFSLNARPGQFEVADFTGFRLLSGPSQSSSSSTQIINGQATTTQSFSYTYVLEATSEGQFSLDPAMAMVDGKKYYSNGLQISVSGQASAPSTSPAQPGRSSPSPSPAESLSDRDIFVRADISRSDAWQGEQLIVTYRLFTRVPVTQYSIDRLPSFQGFWAENLPLPSGAQTSSEIIDGQAYTVAEIRRQVVFPQRSGNLRIEPLELNAVVRVQAPSSGRRSLFDEFFGGSPFGSSSLVERRLRSNAIEIQVRELPAPNRPASFQGLVGQFEVQTALSQNQIKVNEAANMEIKISGRGNLRMADEPLIVFPHMLEAFDANIQDQFRQESQGISGYRLFEYLLIPRTPGEFEIPVFEISWFDPRSAQYETRKIGPFSLNVEGTALTDANMAISQEAIARLGSDILHIYTELPVLRMGKSLFYRSPLFWSLMILPLISFMLLFVFWRKHLRQRGDARLMRNRRARKMAIRRLASAKKRQQEQDEKGFYEEIYRAIWEYAADKLGIARAQLNKEEVNRLLLEQGVSEKLRTEWIRQLETAELARFAPRGSMDETRVLYQQSMELMMKLEKEISRSPRQLKGPGIGLILLLIPGMLLAGDSGQLWHEASKAYQEGAYAHAVSLYESLLDQGISSAELHYNLGNAFFRENQMGPAILHYERALRLAPRDERIRHNLEIARGRITDRAETIPRPFYQRWWESFSLRKTADGWAVYALIMMVLFLTALWFYFFASQRLVRKISFFLSMTFLFMWLISLMAAQKIYRDHHLTQELIVMQPRLTAKSAPSAQSADIFVIHQGSKARLLSEMGEWKEIRLPGGQIGWVKSTAVEII